MLAFLTLQVFFHQDCSATRKILNSKEFCDSDILMSKNLKIPVMKFRCVYARSQDPDVLGLSNTAEKKKTQQDLRCTFSPLHDEGLILSAPAAAQHILFRTPHP